MTATTERTASLVELIRERLDDEVDIILNPEPYRAAVRAVLDLCGEITDHYGVPHVADKIYQTIAAELGIDRDGTGNG